MPAVTITNWGGAQDPIEAGTYGAYNQVWLNQQANADKWAAQATANDEAWRLQQLAARQEWSDIHFGEVPYNPLTPGSGGIYGDQRRSEKDNRFTQLTLAGIQQLTAFYFADKQRDAAKEAQDHQIAVWEKESLWAERYQDCWFNDYRPLEKELLEEVKAREEYVAKYDVVAARAVALVRKEFARAKEQLRRCCDPRQSGYYQSELRKMNTEEAKAVAAAVNQAYRAEEARKDVKDAQRDETRFSMTQAGRGHVTASLNSLNSASAAAQIAASYDTHKGFRQATGATLGYWSGVFADRSVQAGQTANSLQNQASLYGMGQGYSGNTSNQFSYGALPQNYINGQSGLSNYPDLTRNAGGYGTGAY